MGAVIACTGVVLTVSIGLVASIQAQVARGGPACGVAAEQLPQLTPLAAQTGRLATGEVRCFALPLQEGEFIRISVEADGVVARAFDPRSDRPLQTSQIGKEAGRYYYPPLLAFQASSSGRHVLELAAPQEFGTNARTFTVRVEEYRSATTQAAHREALRDDPRTAWLRGKAVAIRSISANDENFTDLAFLREQLRGVRVVLLGEADHGDGSDFSAKTRLIKFLHREMGFDVLAFESGLFGMSAAWQALQTDSEPVAAFRKGAFRIWAWSEQVQPLIRYVAASARTRRPLELTGFDNNYRTGTAEPESLLPSLRQFLARTGLPSALADPETPPSRALAAFYDGREPEPAEWDKLIASLVETAAQVERRDSGREGLFWAQLLRSMSKPGDGIRDHQMAENLMWLVNRYYRGRKIIVWAHTLHEMRNPQHTLSGRSYGGFSMGQGIWEALGEQSFVVGFTSYTGTAHYAHRPEEQQQSIAPDQHPAFEFEELMEAAGYQFAWVNLRRTRRTGEWLGGSFLARPILHTTEQAPWSEILDAFFFIRTQEPSRKVAGVR